MENPFITALETILDRKYIITNPSKTLRYRKGYRSGRGDALAVVKPGNLTELWQVLKTAVKFDKIIIMQASNTSLTEGSIPAGGYDREVIIVSTTRITHLQLINQGSQVLAFPGTTLYTLENALRPLGREPHSVIGSSCLGASAIGGICNNSGGSLVKRGPAYTELSLFARIDENGELQLVNHLGIDLGDTPEQIVANLDAGNFDPNAVPESPKHGHNHTYQTRVRDIDADSPARYNADPNQLYESSGSAGKVAVFAVRLDTFLKEQNEKVFYIGTNTPHVLELIRRKALSEFENLPVAGEYMHREIYDIAKKYGKDSFIVINKLGTDRLPLLFGMKANAERILDKMKIFKPYLPDRVLQKLSYLFPNHLPKRMEEFREKYEHHLILKMSGTGSAEAEAYLTEFFKEAEGDFFVCTPKEGADAFLHRFVAAGAAIRFQEVHQDEVDDILALDIALRRNDLDWFEELPEEISSQIEHKLYYGHFLCHVLHQDYIVKKGVDAHALKEKMLELLDARGAIYPAEHNVGHLYEAAPSLVDHYKNGDPTNSFNPGIGKTSKLKNWA
ncbi:D-lactate dehydrogenase [Neobacillus sp. PS3-12]|jgi:D-lactate dehydrogenase (quinone)|uniref:D-lactate dehydrogenase n=1 Tax=Neobacillus sp. PS3-12 TaxID=3070677 RepID=UPI0027DFAC97|nr:D-lactate dehydrogenase [Neobacillus sp. PS3-12]WML53391.1 D-lactate dehydrogenase [Neobacillus sp. PS3-12]